MFYIYSFRLILLYRASSIKNFLEYIALTMLAMSFLNHQIRALDYYLKLVASRISCSSSTSLAIYHVIAIPLRQLIITASTYCSKY